MGRGDIAPHTLSVIRISAVGEAAHSRVFALMWMVFVPSLALNFVFGLTHNSIIISSLTNLAILYVSYHVLEIHKH